MKLTENHGFAIVFGIILMAGILGMYIQKEYHIHDEREVDATIIGLTTVKTGSGWSSASESRCIMETVEGERINSNGSCFFIVGDHVNLKIHDKYIFITLLEK